MQNLPCDGSFRLKQILEKIFENNFHETKFLKDLDDAVLRRFTKRIYVRLPCTADRSRLVQQLLGQQYNELSEREVSSDFSLTRLTSLLRCTRLHS